MVYAGRLRRAVLSTPPARPARRCAPGSSRRGSARQAVQPCGGRVRGIRAFRGEPRRAAPVELPPVDLVGVPGRRRGPGRRRRGRLGQPAGRPCRRPLRPRRPGPGEFPRRRSAWRGRLLVDWGPVPGCMGGCSRLRRRPAASSGPTLRGTAPAHHRDRRPDSGGRGFAPSKAVSSCGMRAPGSPLRRGNVCVPGTLPGWPAGRCEGISWVAPRSGAWLVVRRRRRVADYPRRVEAVLGAEMAAAGTALAAFRHREAFHAAVTEPARRVHDVRPADLRRNDADRQVRRPASAASWRRWRVERAEREELLSPRTSPTRCQECGAAVASR